MPLNPDPTEWSETQSSESKPVAQGALSAGLPFSALLARRLGVTISWQYAVTRAGADPSAYQCDSDRRPFLLGVRCVSLDFGRGVAERPLGVRSGVPIPAGCEPREELRDRCAVRRLGPRGLVVCALQAGPGDGSRRELAQEALVS